MSELPEVGSRWTHRKWPHGKIARVMAVVDGWVIYRTKNKHPELMHVNQWHDSFVIAPLRIHSPNYRTLTKKEFA